MKFKIQFQQRDQQARFENGLIGLDSSAASEIRALLNELETRGEIPKASLYRSNISIARGSHCQIEYKKEKGSQTIQVIDIVNTDFIKSLSIDDDWNDENIPEADTLPQYDSPDKMLDALDLIYFGVVTPYEIASELGHCSKKEKDIRRHGSYVLKALEDQLKLIKRTTRKGCGKNLFASLTENGQRICQVKDKDLKKRLLVESMLSYPVVRKVLQAVTQPNESDVLTTELIIRVASRAGVLSDATSYRRAQALKSWINWIASYMFLPVRSHQDGVQQNLFSTSLDMIEGKY
jgi:hypothetical protein